MSKERETGYVRCNNCGNVYNEEGYNMEMFSEGEGKFKEFFKGCSVCETDEYLMDITEEEFFETIKNQEDKKCF